MRPTQQEIFDASARFLVKQGARAMRGLACVYEDKQGRRCAVGALMTDDEIGALRAAHMLDQNVQGLADLLPERLVRDAGFLGRLQFAHDAKPDGAFFGGRDSWEARMRELANEYTLSTAALDAALAARGAL